MPETNYQNPVSRQQYSQPRQPISIPKPKDYVTVLDYIRLVGIVPVILFALSIIFIGFSIGHIKGIILFSILTIIFLAILVLIDLGNKKIIKTRIISYTGAFILLLFLLLVLTMRSLDNITLDFIFLLTLILSSIIGLIYHSKTERKYSHEVIALNFFMGIVFGLAIGIVASFIFTYTILSWSSSFYLLVISAFLVSLALFFSLIFISLKLARKTTGTPGMHDIRKSLIISLIIALVLTAVMASAAAFITVNFFVDKQARYHKDHVGRINSEIESDFRRNFPNLIMAENSIVGIKTQAFPAGFLTRGETKSLGKEDILQGADIFLSRNEEEWNIESPPRLCSKTTFVCREISGSINLNMDDTVFVIRTDQGEDVLFIVPEFTIEGMIELPFGDYYKEGIHDLRFPTELHDHLKEEFEDIFEFETAAETLIPGTFMAKVDYFYDGQVFNDIKSSVVIITRIGLELGSTKTAKSVAFDEWEEIKENSEDGTEFSDKTTNLPAHVEKLRQDVNVLYNDYMSWERDTSSKEAGTYMSLTEELGEDNIPIVRVQARMETVSNTIETIKELDKQLKTLKRDFNPTNIEEAYLKATSQHIQESDESRAMRFKAIHEFLIRENIERCKEGICNIGMLKQTITKDLCVTDYIYIPIEARPPPSYIGYKNADLNKVCQDKFEVS